MTASQVLIDYIARSTTSKDPAVLSEVYQAMFACHSLLEDEDLEEKQVEAMSHLRKECLRAAKTPTRLVRANNGCTKNPLSSCAFTGDIKVCANSLGAHGRAMHSIHEGMSRRPREPDSQKVLLD